jgi:tetratricopeptide (TPR) repeat protein
MELIMPHRCVAVTLSVLVLLLPTNTSYAQSVLAQTYNQAGIEQGKAGNHAASVKSFDLGIREAERANDVRQLAAGLILRGEAYLNLEKWPEAEKDLARGLETAKKALPNARDPVILEAVDNLALSYSRQNKDAAAEPYYRWLLPAYERAEPRDPKAITTTVSNLALTLNRQKKYAEAITYYRRLADESTRANGRRSRETENYLIDLVNCLRKNGDNSEVKKIEAELKAAVSSTGLTEVPAYVRLRRGIAQSENAAGHVGEAAVILEELLPLLVAKTTKIIEARSEVISDLGDYYLTLNRVNDALSMFRQNVEVLTRENGATDRKTLDALYNVGWTCYRARTLEEGLKFAQQAFDGYKAKLTADDVAVAHAARLIGHIKREQKDWEGARDQYDLAATMYQRAGKESTANAVASLNDMSRALIELNRPADARRALERALALREAVHGVKSLEAARGVSDLAWFHRTQGDLATAEQLYIESVSRSEAVVGKESPELTTFLTALASVYRAQGKNDQAEEVLKRNLRLVDGRGNSVELKNALSDLAHLFEELSRYAEAESMARRATSVAEAVHGNRAPETAAEAKQLAWILMRLDRWDDGRRIGVSAIDVLERAGSNWEESLAGAYNTVAACLRSLNDLDGAESHYKKCLAIEERKDHNGAYFVVYNLGLLYEARGNVSLAESQYRDAIDRLEKNKVEHPPKREVDRLHNALAECRHFGALAELCTRSRRLDEAETLLRRVIVTLETTFGDSHVDLTGALENLGDLLAEQDKHVERIPLAAKQLQLVAKLLPEYHLGQSGALENQAKIDIQRGKLRDAERNSRRAVEIAEKVYGSDKANLMAHYDDLFSVLKAEGKVDDARRIAGRIADLRKKLESDSQLHQNALAVAASLASFDGDYAAALQNRQALLAFRQGKPGNKTSGFATQHFSIASAAIDVGDLAIAQAALTAGARSVGDATPHRLTRAWMAEVEAAFAAAIDDNKKAEGFLREVVELRLRAPDVYPIALIEAELSLARFLAETSQSDDGEVLFASAQTRMSSGIDVMAPLQVMADSTAAFIKLKKDDLDAAMGFALKAHKTASEVFGPGSPKAADTASLLGKICLRFQKVSDAVAYAKKAVEIRRRCHLEDAKLLIDAQDLLLMCQMAGPDASEADQTRRTLEAAKQRRDARIATLAH